MINDANVNDCVLRKWIGCTCEPPVICSVIAVGIINNSRPVRVEPICFALVLHYQADLSKLNHERGLLDSKVSVYTCTSWCHWPTFPVCVRPRCPLQCFVLVFFACSKKNKKKQIHYCDRQRGNKMWQGILLCNKTLPKPTFGVSPSIFRDGKRRQI